MKRQHTYEQIIGRKLNGLAAPDVAGLWNNMESILDREMPQQKEKKRPAAWWFNTNMLVAAGLLVAVGSLYTLDRMAGSEPVATTITVATAPVKSSKENTASERPNAKTVTGVATAALSSEEKNVVVTAKADVHNQMSSVRLTATKAQVVERRTDVSTTVNNPEAVTTQPTVMDAAATNNVSEETVAMANEEIVSAITEPLKEAIAEQANMPAHFNHQPVNTKTPVTVAPKKKTTVYSERGLVAGLSASLPVALGSQQKNALDMQGRKAQWQDVAPSVYAQYHLSKKFYLQAEWQPVTAQYTPGFTLYDRTDVLNPDEKSQKVVKLNKLFYTALPLSFHYNTPVKNLSVGLGVQYNKLKKVVLQDQEYYHLIGAGGVFNVDQQKNEVVVKDPEAVRSHSSGDVVDSVARSFRREDWRLLAEVDYRYKSLQLGVRYTNGVQNYINSNFTNLQVKDRNESLQFYLRVNLFDSRKKTF